MGGPPNHPWYFSKDSSESEQTGSEFNSFRFEKLTSRYPPFLLTTLKAAALENNCNAAGCNDPHAMGKAQEAKLVKKVEPPPVPNMEDEIRMRIVLRRRYHKKGLTGSETIETTNNKHSFRFNFLFL